MSTLEIEAPAVQTLPPLKSLGLTLDPSPSALGVLPDSSHLLSDIPALRQRMETDGFIFLRNFFNRDDVMAARREVCRRFATENVFLPGTDPIEGLLAKPDAHPGWRPDLMKNNLPVYKVVYGLTIMKFFDAFLGGPSMHYDFTWFRSIAPGLGTHPHCDVPYMGRGTHNLFTAWTPLGDISFKAGGLMMLEGSHRLPELHDYLHMDVDAYCANKTGDEARFGWDIYPGGGLTRDPVGLQKKLGGRWLTTEYNAGDVILFSVYTVHGSLDNTSERSLRLSTDTRYQLKKDPVDERWMGENPIAHGAEAKRGLIC